MAGLTTPPARRRSLTSLVADPRFQRWAARFPLTRWIVRREGAALFDLVAGFCHSQVLMAFVALDLPGLLRDGPRDSADLARAADLPADRMAVLLQASVSLGLLRRARAGYALSVRGAALAGVPGLADMILHHRVLYRDLSDPVAFFRDEVDTDLARFWPYVFGAGAATDPDTAARYSRLMADSVALVADDTLDAVPLRGVTRLMDVGGGSGAFLAAAALRHPALAVTLVDLPAVVPAAQRRFADLGLTARLTVAPLSFRDSPLPTGADAVSLIRVLYDHGDLTVAALLRAVHDALPPGGLLILSEPMTGGAVPQRPGDAYFALYCMAMRTGRARSATEIASLLQAAGFTGLRGPVGHRPYVTSVITARRSRG